MEEEGSCAELMTKTWGFRRSTIARREFMEAVGSVDDSPPTPQCRGRPARSRGSGRGRGRGRGKRAAEAAVISPASKRGRGGRGRALVSVITPDAEESSSENEARLYGAAEGVMSDRAEDSDDLNLQEIRKRAVARRLQELQHGDVGGVKHTRDTDGGVPRADVNGSDATETASEGEKVCVLTASGNSVETTADERTDRMKRELTAEEEMEENPSDVREEDSERVNHGADDAVCGTCQQRLNNRSGICCESGQEWRHVNSEACGQPHQRNGEEHVSPSRLTDDHDIMRNNNTTNSLRNKQDTCSFSEVEQEQLEEIEVKVEKKVDAAFPKCIGPGCSSEALPESVYCGHQCIVQHAAVAMKSLSEPKPEIKSAVLPLVKSEKRSFLAKLFKVKINKTPAQEEHVIKAEVAGEESLCSAAVTDPAQPTTSSTPPVDPKPTIKDNSEVEHHTTTLQSQPSGLTPAAPLVKRCTPGRAKKTMPGSPRLELLKGALSKSPLSGLKKPSESSKPPEVSVSEPPVASQASPLMIRQNIRRSLFKVLLRRLNHSTDVNISENDIEKLVVDLEKEMFNKCYTTGNEYKNKSQDLILALKDPKHKELSLQVLRGNLPLTRLICVSQQEAAVDQGSSFLSVPMEEPTPPPSPPAETTPSTQEEKSSQLKQTEAKGISLDASAVISCMLKDTTSEHKYHFFDLNCTICTGHASTHDSEIKKPTMKEMTDTEKEDSSCVVQALDSPALDSNIIESPASPSAEDLDSPSQVADCSPVVIPSVPLVSISGRDPRTAQYQKALSEFAPAPLQPPAKKLVESPKETQPPVHLPAPVPKSILMKPSSSLGTSFSSTTRLADGDKGTRQFLSRQSILWKGFLNMPTVAKFVTKGYLISGSPDFLKEDLPDTIQIGGRILPQTVWEYVDLIKTSEAKELSLIRFHPASEEEEVAYVSLFSYFNSRRRFGVVSNICKHIKDLYLIPLCTKQSIPAVLLPIEGPGLEADHPNLIMGLAVCQKLKGLPQDAAEKKSKSLICKENPTSLKNLGQHNVKCDDVFLNSNLPSFEPQDVSCSTSPSSVPGSKPVPSKDSTTPLQTILNTLFGQKKPHSDVTECKKSSTDKDDAMTLVDDMPYDPEDYDPAVSNGPMVPLSPTEALEPKVASAATEVNDDDRPYDPEEEYSAIGHVRSGTPKLSEVKCVKEISTVNSDIAYDPEDETVFEEMQTYLISNAVPHKSTTSEINLTSYEEDISTATLSEQQRILEELNRQIEEQKRQLEEQTETLRLQKEAIGLSMAHFSVSDALMSPPPQFGRDEIDTETPYFPVTLQNKDPQIFLKTSQDVGLDNAEREATEKDLNKPLIPKEESLPSERATVDGESNPNPLQGDTKGSRSEKKESRSRSKSSSRMRSGLERRSHHHDRSSSRTIPTGRSSKDVSDKQYRRRPSSEGLSRGSYSDRKRKRHHHHHHRDSSSPSRSRRRSHYSTVSHSRRRHKSDPEQQESSTLPENSTPTSQLDPDQSVTARLKDEKLAEDQQDGQNQALQTSRNSSQPNKPIDKKLAQLHPFDSSSTQGQPNIAHNDDPLHRVTSALKPSKIQTDVFHYESTSPSSQPPHNQRTHFSETDQKRGTPSVPRLNYSQIKKDQSSGEYRNLAQCDSGKLYNRELPQDNDPPEGLARRQFRRFPLEDTDKGEQSTSALRHKQLLLEPTPVHFRPSSFDQWKPLRERSFTAKDTPCETSCLQTFGVNEEDGIQPNVSRQAPTQLSRDPICRLFAGRQSTDIQSQPRGLHKSDFRGARRGTFLGRGPRFDSPQQFLSQRESAADLKGQSRPSPNSFVSHDEAHLPSFPKHSSTTSMQFKKMHQNPCEIQHLRTFEGGHRQTYTRPPRLSGPLLPTPPGGPVKLNLSRVHQHNSPNEAHRDYRS